MAGTILHQHISTDALSDMHLALEGECLPSKRLKHSAAHINLMHKPTWKNGGCGGGGGGWSERVGEKLFSFQNARWLQFPDAFSAFQTAVIESDQKEVTVTHTWFPLCLFVCFEYNCLKFMESTYLQLSSQCLFVLWLDELSSTTYSFTHWFSFFAVRPRVHTVLYYVKFWAYWQQLPDAQKWNDLDAVAR